MGEVIDSTHMHINKGKADGRQGKATQKIFLPCFLFYTLSIFCRGDS